MLIVMLDVNGPNAPMKKHCGMRLTLWDKAMT